MPGSVSCGPMLTAQPLAWPPKNSGGPHNGSVRQLGRPLEGPLLWLRFSCRMERDPHRDRIEDQGEARLRLPKLPLRRDCP